MTKEGCFRAFARRDLKVEFGSEKWSDCGFEACRRRQRVCISFCGRVEILERSRKESRVLTPGGGFETAEDWGVGGGGGEGQGDVAGDDDGDDDVDDEVEVEAEVVVEPDDVPATGFSGAVAPGTLASVRSFSILSLYASFNCDTSCRPSWRALDSSFSLYLARMRSCTPWVARKRTSWTWAQRRWQSLGLASGWRRRCRIVGTRTEEAMAGKEGQLLVFGDLKPAAMALKWMDAWW